MDDMVRLYMGFVFIVLGGWGGISFVYELRGMFDHFSKSL